MFCFYCKRFIIWNWNFSWLLLVLSWKTIYETLKSHTTHTLFFILPSCIFLTPCWDPPGSLWASSSWAPSYVLPLQSHLLGIVASSLLSSKALTSTCQLTWCQIFLWGTLLIHRQLELCNARQRIVLCSQLRWLSMDSSLRILIQVRCSTSPTPYRKLFRVRNRRVISLSCQHTRIWP